MDDNVSVPDIFRFFRERLPEMKCPACASDRFNVEVDEKIKFAEWGAQEPSVDEYWPVVIVSCLSCGHISPFSYNFICKWVSENLADKPE
jgi:uncharacterized Zn finger protein